MIFQHHRRFPVSILSVIIAALGPLNRVTGRILKINNYRVAAIFPEHFQSLPVTLKNHFFTDYFVLNCLSSFKKWKQKQADTFRQK
jgi:hypothetical protein